MKKGLLLLLFLCIFFQINAQSQTSTITGTVLDESTNEAIELASVRILNARDSSYVNGTVTDSLGKFRITLNSARYIAQISFMGYKDKFVSLNSQRGNVAMGNITLSDDGVLLGEAVVTGRIVEMQVKGDTLEYNADAYKVQQSAVVEDLLKKMPGVEIDSEGKITVNGKEVKKMLVDGKEFFSDDPKVASKNLPAAMVEKLQVVDRKSEMAQMTGFDDGEEETVINLSIRPGMKQGVFGSGFAGYGNKERYEAGGMVNYMRNNTQMSALGGVNNTNNAGFSDFASSMFSGNRPMRGGMGFGGNNGVAKTINGGFNFATEHSNKLKYGGDVRYGTVDNDVSSNSWTRYTTKDNSRTETSNSWGTNKSDNFGLNMRFEWTPDSLTKVIFRPSFQYNKNNNFQQSEGEVDFVDSPIKNYTNQSSYVSDGKGIRLNGNLDISRKLNNKGRVLSLGLSGGLSDSDSDGFDYTKIMYSDPAKADSILDQRFFQDDKSYNWRVFVSFVEPIGRNNFIQLSYNIRNNNSETDKKTYYNDGTGNYNDIDTLYTRNVKNDFINQNVSLSFKAVREKYNYTIGVGLEPSSSKTTIIEPNKPELDTPRKNFLSFAPNAQFNYMWDRRHNLRLDYKGTTNQPTTLQLYNGIYSRSGLNTTSGNPDLRPSFENRVYVRYQNFNSAKASMLMVRGSFSHVSNDIVTVTSWNDAGGRNSTYENISGNMSGNVRVIYNTPLKNKKLSFNTMSYASYSKRNTFISTFGSTERNKNVADVYGFSENIGLSFRSDVIDFSARGNFSYNNVKNSISSQEGQETFNYGGTGDFTLYLPFNFTVQSDLRYSTNSGYSDGFKQQEWLWNASLAKDIFKAKNGTIRFKIYDILKERSNISRRTGDDYIQDITTNTINSYFMVHFIYKFQIFKGGAKMGDMQRGRGPGGYGGGPGRF